MFRVKLIFLLFLLQGSKCQWFTDWIFPDPEPQLPSNNTQTEPPSKKQQNNVTKLRKPRNLMDLQAFEEDLPVTVDQNVVTYGDFELSTPNLKDKLEGALKNAQALADVLKTQILHLSKRENAMKDIIVNGKSGLSTVTVATLQRPPRTYMVRDSQWLLCNGDLQYPSQAETSNLFTDLLTAPKCIGQELATTQDPCVFNSVIKYETIPTYRAVEYMEEDYFCLKRNFNASLERYLSVPKRVVNETCVNGIVRSLADITQECGLRIMSEYTYYPQKNAVELPLEYCAEKDGSCKLIIAWHVSNSTVENFEFFKNEKSFKKYFMKPGLSEHL